MDLLDLKAKRASQESKVHQDLVVSLDQKDPKEVLVILDSRDPTANPAYKDLREKTARMVLMVKLESRDPLVMLDLRVKWELLDRPENLVRKDQRVLKVAPDFLETRVTKVGAVFLALLEPRVTREFPDLQDLQVYEAHLEHRYWLYIYIYIYIYFFFYKLPLYEDLMIDFQLAG